MLCGQTVRSGLVYTKTHLVSALVNAVAVLVIACHRALGLATPAGASDE